MRCIGTAASCMRSAMPVSSDAEARITVSPRWTLDSTRSTRSAVCAAASWISSTALRMATNPFALSSASLRSSSATTAKPRPWSPARAASIAAFKANRFDCRAMPSIIRANSPTCVAFTASARTNGPASAVAMLMAWVRSSATAAAPEPVAAASVTPRVISRTNSACATICVAWSAASVAASDTPPIACICAPAVPASVCAAAAISSVDAAAASEFRANVVAMLVNVPALASMSASSVRSMAPIWRMASASAPSSSLDVWSITALRSPAVIRCAAASMCSSGAVIAGTMKNATIPMPSNARPMMATLNQRVRVNRDSAAVVASSTR